jgi:peptide subunit release factor RF-3
VDAVFEPVQVATARWIACKDEKMLNDFEKKLRDNHCARWRRRADLPRAVAREPPAHHGALAGHHL